MLTVAGGVNQAVETIKEGPFLAISCIVTGLKPGFPA